MSDTILRCSCTLILLISTYGYAQQVRIPLITRPIDDNAVVTLKGNTHPMARLMFDIGAAPPNLAMDRMLLVLKRDPQQDLAVRRLLDDQQDKNSANYHQWLTPKQFGAQFGAADQDIQLIAGWLQNHGFQVNRVSNGRSIIEFSGIESQVEQAFHTQIHRYALPNGEQHWANASDPQIPAALAPAVEGVVTLHNFPRKPMLEVLGKYNGRTGQLLRQNPQFTTNFQGGTAYAVGPADFGTIYNVQSLWTSGTDGSGQKIAIVGRTDINIQDTRDFRNLFGLPANDPVITYDGPNPGVAPDESESNIDVQWAGAIAPKATINFVTSQSTETADGVDLSAIYVVDNNLAPVMSVSYGLCELGLGTAGNQFYNSLWQQAAAQGISVVVASGDNGAAGCDLFYGNYPQPALYGLEVSGFASTPYNVAVGGTDFNDPFNPSTYWNSVNTSPTLESAKSYIPEVPWNDSCTNPVLSQAGFSSNAETRCNDPQLINGGLIWTVGGSGGVSNCTVNSQALGTCSGGYTKPSWQVGSLNDGKRDVPDVSFFASNGFMNNFYVYCQADAYGACSTFSFGAAGGTSFGAPIFAGVMALVNQQMQTPGGQGNPNYILYKLAGQQTASSCNSSTGPASTCVFNDVVSGTIAMPCQSASLNCTVQTAGHQFGVLSGHAAGSGYDLATGLGTINVGNLLSKWNSVTFRPTTTTLNLSPTSNLTHGQSVTVTGSVAPSSGSGTPTGNVSLLTSTGLKVDGFALGAGSALSGSTNMLPGGSYTVTAHYAGDTTFGGSDSLPVSVSVGKENSSTQLQLKTFDWQGNLLSLNATTAVYGSPYLLRVNVLNSLGTACEGSNGLPLFGCPTGNVNLTDNSSPLDGGTFGLNSIGYTEDQIIQLPGGNNAINAQYAGDNSFNGSATSASYSITKAQTTLGAPTVFGGIVGVGTTFTLTTNVQSMPSSGAAPTGSVTFYSNGAAQTGIVNFTPFSAGTLSNSFKAWSIGDITFTSPPFTAPGTYNITASYSGDANYQPSNSPVASFSVMFATPTLTLQATPSSVNAGSTGTLTATVQGSSPTLAPTGNVVFSENYYTTGNGPIPGTVSYSTVTDPNTGNLDLKASLTVTPTYTDSYSVAYSGDKNYPLAFTNGQVVTVNGNDFVLTAQVPSATVIVGNAASYELFLGVQSNTAPIAFGANACSGLPAESSCVVSPDPSSSTGFVGLAISTTAPHSAVAGRFRSSSSPVLWLIAMPFAAIFFIASPHRRDWRFWSPFLAMVFLLSLGCGGGGGGGGGGGPSDPGTPRGIYTITVTATSGAISHSQVVTLKVQ